VRTGVGVGGAGRDGGDMEGEEGVIQRRDHGGTQVYKRFTRERKKKNDDE